jgi:hypothetical protein
MVDDIRTDIHEVTNYMTQEVFGFARPDRKFAAFYGYRGLNSMLFIIDLF